MQEIHRPDVVRVCRGDVTRCVSTAAAALLPAWDLQAFFPPDPPHPLAVHLPALPAQDRMLLLVAQARVTVGELVQPAAEVLFVGHQGPSVPLG